MRSRASIGKSWPPKLSVSCVVVVPSRRPLWAQVEREGEEVERRTWNDKATIAVRLGAGDRDVNRSGVRFGRDDEGSA
jgi:hypothetical protein